MRDSGRYACGLLMLAIMAGCTPQKPAPRPRWFVSTQPSSPPAISGPTATQPESAPILLRSALLPPVSAQPFTVTLEEQLESSPEVGPPTIQQLRIELAGALTGQTLRPRTDCRAVLTLDRIAVHYQGLDSGSLEYDSDRRAGNAAALELLSQAKGAGLSLLLTPRARLREISGLDSLWRPADLLPLPPTPRMVLARFRNTSMADLLGEALFPALPSGTIGPRDHWEAEIPADVPGVAPLTSVLKGQLERTTTGPEGLPLAHLKVTGTIQPASVAVGWSGRRVELRQASHQIDLVVDWNSRSLRQENRREIELARPLDSTSGPLLIIRQTRTLTASRGRIEAAAEP